MQEVNLLDVDDTLVLEVYTDGNAELFLRNPGDDDAVVVYPETIPALRAALLKAREVLTGSTPADLEDAFTRAVRRLGRDDLADVLLTLYRYTDLDRYTLEFLTIYKVLSDDSQRLIREKIKELATGNDD
jgi:hypothetical protein